MTAMLKVESSYSSSMEWVPADSIELDHPTLQRRFEITHAKAIAEKFDPDALGKPLLVSLPKRGVDHFVSIDGQHRIAAVKLALGAGQLIECEVLRGIQIPHAARLFGLRNTFKRPSSLDRFLKAVTALEPEQVAINRIVQQLGLKVMGGNADGYVCCVGALEAVYRGDTAKGNGRNELALKRTLGTALRAWGSASTSFQGDIIHGLGLFVIKNGDVVEFDALEANLAAFPKGALGLLGKAKGSRETMGGSLSQNVAATIVREYNKKRRRNALPDWFTTR